LKFAKIIFTLAGIWGILITLPVYFLYDFIGKQSPPPINHPEFYYGFVGVTLAWQVVFLLVGRDPYKYRMMMIPAVREKCAYVLANLVLFLRHNISASQAVPSISDLVLATLFIAAFVKTTSVHCVS
jgi:hypothetical protein